MRASTSIIGAGALLLVLTGCSAEQKQGLDDIRDGAEKVGEPLAPNGAKEAALDELVKSNLRVLGASQLAARADTGKYVTLEELEKRQKGYSTAPGVSITTVSYTPERFCVSARHSGSRTTYYYDSSKGTPSKTACK